MFVQRANRPVDTLSFFFLIKHAAFLFVLFLDYAEALLMRVDKKSGIRRVLARRQRRRHLKLAQSQHTGWAFFPNL